MKVSAKINTRALAAKILLKVLQQGISFSPQLVAEAFPHLTLRDRAFIVHLCFGVLRYYPRLTAWVETYLSKSLKLKDFDIQLLLLIGLFQILYSDTPVYASINETVAGTQTLKKPWAKGLINSVLRQVHTKPPTIMPDSSLEIRSAHPRWLAESLQKAWPLQAETIFDANNSHPPLVLRVNLNQQSREHYRQKLAEKNIENLSLIHSPAAILLPLPQEVTTLPYFSEGACSVQDEAAQLAAGLLAPKAGERILDACAAPGGKMAHLLEAAPGIELTAVEYDKERIPLLEATLKRIKLSATIISEDAASPAQWWDGRMFDKILLDAPCSATGVIRRHPDIKHHRTLADISQLVALQNKLLNALWPLLKPGGILLYATCSILPQENTEQLVNFLQAHKDAHEDEIVANWGKAQTVGRQILPGDDGMDGFYYARLIKAL